METANRKLVRDAAREPELSVIIFSPCTPSGCMRCYCGRTRQKRERRSKIVLASHDRRSRIETGLYDDFQSGCFTSTRYVRWPDRGYSLVSCRTRIAMAAGFSRWHIHICSSLDGTSELRHIQPRH